MCVSQLGLLFVADRDNHRVQVFRMLDGSFIRAFGSKGSGDGEFCEPLSVCLSPDETEILVADSRNHRIQVCRQSITIMIMCSTAI